ncbi:MAG: hypothetical protein Q9227_009040, partial [Pyrenula ochraceoflavens]
MENFIDTIRQDLPFGVFTADGAEYTESLRSYFSAQESDIKPALIIHPRTTEDVCKVVSALVQANENSSSPPVKFAVRSGGHTSFPEAANQQDGVTIDLRGLNSIEISDDKSAAIIGTGASWGEVYRTLDAQGLMVPGGRHSKVGVGGLTLGGGLSHFSGDVGLVCDNVLEYEIVLASGTALRVTENPLQHKELFDALHGASNNFGIVTRFKFRIFPQKSMWGGTLFHGLESKDQQLKAYHDFAAGIPEYDPLASLIHSCGMSEKGSAFVSNLIMLSTTYHLSLALIHRTYDLWSSSCDAVRTISGIKWSITFQTIHPAVISKSPFLQSALPSTRPRTTIVVAQLCATWQNSSDSNIVEEEAFKLIRRIEDAAKQEEGSQTGYTYLNYVHGAQKGVWGGGERVKWLRE